MSGTVVGTVLHAKHDTCHTPVALARTVRLRRASLQEAYCRPALPFETTLRPSERVLNSSNSYCSSKPAVRVERYYYVIKRLRICLKTTHISCVHDNATDNLPLTVVEAYSAIRHALDALGPSLTPPTVRRVANVCTQALKTKVG